MARGKGNAQPHWHPDYRIADTLPDIKVVRTSFLVNFVMIALALASIVYFTVGEVNRMALNSQIQDLEAEKRANTAENNRVLRLSKQYTDEEKLVKDAITFHDTTYPILDIVRAVSLTVPDNMLLRSIDIVHDVKMGGSKRKREAEGRFGAIRLSGFLQGDSNADVAEIIAFQDRISELPELKDAIESISSSPPRAGTTPYSFNFDINIVLKMLK